MSLYVTLFIALVILREWVAIEASPTGASNKLTSLAIGGFLAAFTAVRVDTGTDFSTYEAIWDYTSTLSGLTIEEVFFHFLEPLFVITTATLKTLEPDPWILFAIYGVATIFLLHRSIGWFRLNGPHAYLVYVGLFLLPYAFNGLRQALAMSIFLYTLRYMLQRRTGLVILCTVIAAGFHLTGILIGLAYATHRLTENREFQLIRWFFWGALLAGFIGLAGLGGRLFFMLFEYKAETYTELFNEGSSLSNIGVRLVLAGLLVYGASVSQPSRLVRQLLVMYSLGLFLYLALSEFNVLATRFNMFFRVLEVILIPMLLAQMRGVRTFALHGAFCALMLIALVTVASSPDYEYQSTIVRQFL